MGEMRTVFGGGMVTNLLRGKKHLWMHFCNSLRKRGLWRRWEVFKKLHFLVRYGNSFRRGNGMVKKNRVQFLNREIER